MLSDRHISMFEITFLVYSTIISESYKLVKNTTQVFEDIFTELIVLGEKPSKDNTVMNIISLGILRIYVGLKLLLRS
jgi:hypothetical protein